MEIKFILVLLLLVQFSFSQKNVHYEVEKLNSNINSEATDEISPVVTNNGKVMFFTRVKDPNFNKTLYDGKTNLATELKFDDYKHKIEEIYSYLENKVVSEVVLSEYNQDIWKASSPIAGKFDQLDHLDYPINNALTNSACYINPLTNDLFLINQFTKDGGIKRGFSVSTFHSTYGYQHPVDIEIQGVEYSGGNINMCMSEDNQFIVFSSSHEGNSDLFISSRISYLKWEMPKKLPPNLNTSFIESSPFLLANDRLMFFTSTQNDNDADIYVSIRLGSGWNFWSKPHRLPHPINTDANEGGVYYHAGFIYFSSNRGGSWDIFRTKFNPARYVDDYLKNQDNLRIVGKMDTSSTYPTTLLNNPSAPAIFPFEMNTEDTTYHLQIKLFDAITSRPVSGILYINDPIDSNINVLNIPENGIIINQDSFLLDKKVFTFEKDNYFEYNQHFNYRPRDISFNIFLMPKGNNINLVTKPILFERATPHILESSFSNLNHIVNQLKQYNTIHIHIAGHTDNIGDEKNKIILSQKRAFAIYNYFKDKGIDIKRMSYRGYGDSKPIAPNDSEENREKNRRVEIKTVNIDS